MFFKKQNKSKHEKTNFFVRGGHRDRSVGGFYIAAIAEDIQIEVIANEIIADKHFYPLRKNDSFCELFFFFFSSETF